MTKEVIEPKTIDIDSEEKKEQLIKMSETAPTKSAPCDDKKLLIENSKDPCDSITSKTCVKNKKEEINQVKDLNGDVENNTAGNDKKERDDNKNNQLVEIDNVEKSIENVDSNISGTKDNENNEITQVEAKPLENANLKDNDHQENEQQMENDTVDKSIENNTENEQHMEIDTEEKSIENNAENDIPIKNKNDDNAQVVEKPLENANLKQNDNGEHENNLTVEKTIHHSASKVVEQNKCNEDEVNKNTVENKKEEKDNLAINKLKEIDNVSNIENHVEKDNGAIIKLKEIDNVSNIENHVEKDNGAINKLKEMDNVSNIEKDNGAINKLKEMDNVSNIEKPVEKDNGAINKLKEMDNVSNIEKPVEKDNGAINKLKEMDNVSNIEKDNGAINKLKEMDNVSNIENPVEKDNGAINKLKKMDNVSNIGKCYIKSNNVNGIPVITIYDDEDEDENDIQFVEKPLENSNLKVNNDGDKDKTFTDVEKNEKKVVSNNTEELELGVNMIKDAPMPKDNEQKSEYDVDKNSDEREIKLIECNDNSEEDIQKKTKSEGKKEEKPAENVDEQEVVKTKIEHDEEDMQKKRKIEMGNDEEIDLNSEGDAIPEKSIHKKIKMN